MEQLSIATRPRVLSQVLGQPAVVKALQNRAKKGKWPRAMLFEGPSGTGKTSVAQLVAMTINCTGSPPPARPFPGRTDDEKLYFEAINAHKAEEAKRAETGDPCGKCASCRSIIEERFDGGTLRLTGTATSKGEVVDFIQLSQGTSLYARNKIFIIEEANGLSKLAREAMLKELEHPGGNTYFLLLSMVRNGMGTAVEDRCQKLVFHPLGVKDMMLSIRQLMVNADVWNQPGVPKTFYTEVIPLIVENANGSLRKAIQLIESCLFSELYTSAEAEVALDLVDVSATFGVLKAGLELDVDFFEKLDVMEGDKFQKFFDLGYAILASGLATRVGAELNNYYAAQNKFIADHGLGWKLAEVFEACHSTPYLRKSHFVSRMAEFFGKNKARRIVEG